MQQNALSAITRVNCSNVQKHICAITKTANKKKVLLLRRN